MQDNYELKTIKGYRNSMPYNDGWKVKTGALGFKMCNDYLFRAFLQCDEESLRALIAALMRTDPGEIEDVIVTNPIVLGETILSKEIRLDIHVVLKSGKHLDIEMQSYSHKGWMERSLFYACRCYDSLDHGDLYHEHPGVWQIEFCNFRPFADYQGFYFNFYMREEDCHEHIFSDKFKISIVDMTSVDMAKAIDVEQGLAKWARLFRATTWEELKMLAQEDKSIDKALSTAWQLTEDERIRDQMQRREDSERYWNALLKDVSDTKQALEASNRALSEKTAALEDAEQEIVRLKAELAARKA
jgi:predicted transposase/invertase (TIGR01784 family)